MLTFKLVRTEQTLFFALYPLISFCVCTCFNKRLHLFPVFPAKYEEFRGDLRLLHSAIGELKYHTRENKLEKVKK